MHEDRNNAFVLIVEDHPLVADSLIACIRGSNAALEVQTAETLLAATRTLAVRSAPQLIVTDLTLTDAKGIEAVRRLREAAPQSPLLVFTALDDAALRREALALGAAGYLIKSASIQAIRDKIQAMVGGVSVAGNQEPSRAGTLEEIFTRKQLQVLEELPAGRSNREIAARLGISEETVRSHMKEILGRLGVRNRTEGVARYLKMIDQQRDHS
ncbi:MAG: response regulator transcription factor [Burkholderiales bacterium]|nr:response regulator transcription factor [Burkholderiales bacterium]